MTQCLALNTWLKLIRYNYFELDSALVDQLAIVSATLGKQAEPHMNTKNRSLIEVLQADQV